MGPALLKHDPRNQIAKAPASCESLAGRRTMKNSNVVESFAADISAIKADIGWIKVTLSEHCQEHRFYLRLTTGALLAAGLSLVVAFLR